MNARKAKALRRQARLATDKSSLRQNVVRDDDGKVVNERTRCWVGERHVYRVLKRTGGAIPDGGFVPPGPLVGHAKERERAADNTNALVRKLEQKREDQQLEDDAVAAAVDGKQQP